MAHNSHIGRGRDGNLRTVLSDWKGSSTYDGRRSGSKCAEKPSPDSPSGLIGPATAEEKWFPGSATREKRRAVDRDTARSTASIRHRRSCRWHRWASRDGDPSLQPPTQTGYRRSASQIYADSYVWQPTPRLPRLATRRSAPSISFSGR